MSAAQKKVKEKKESSELEKKTIQIIGFGTGGSLLIFKLGVSVIGAIMASVAVSEISEQVPWWVIFAFFGFGASATFDLLSNITELFKGKN